MEPGKIERLCLTARQAIADRDWDKAKQAYLMALGLRSDAPDIHMGLATVYFQLRELTSAAHHFREVTRLDPLRAGAYINLGAVLNLLQELEDAVAALRRGIQLDPQRVEGYYNLGLVYRRKGQLDLALQAYREAIRLNPRMADAYLNLANLYVEKKQYRQAIQNYEESLKIRPNWEKALEGRDHAQALLSGDRPVPVSVPAKGQPNARRSNAVEEKTVDPNIHGDLLSSLHTGAEAAEELGRRFQKVLGDEMEGAIKELSSCLLYANGPTTELGSCVSRFEQALEHILAAQKTLEMGVTHIEHLNQHFPSH
ncbi:MAG TPA: tetratricopeptide repeat protein [Gemmataceae bacterium]|nr:tetratricopeptide repeat protein [Gemmataceae bacterium]